MSEDQKRSVFISIPEKGGVKNVQTARTVTLISHASGYA